MFLNSFCVFKQTLKFQLLSIFHRELMDVIHKFRDEEQEHHDTGLEHGAEQAPFYKLMTDVIKVGCKVAIGVAKVV
jgi:Ubiquinone biosynthesis protein COQ7